MKKKVGAIISVLKPVDDIRMYNKMAQSLAGTGKFSVNILGFSSNTHSNSPDIKFHSCFKFGLRNFRRLLANPLIFWKLLIIRPMLIIVCTPELAPAVLLIKMLFPQVAILYDIQENHLLNMKYHHQSAFYLRKWLIRVVDVFEKQLARNSELLLVAENGYYLEKPWLKKFRNILLENKAWPSDVSKIRDKASKIKLLYTGTISTIYGIWDTLRFAEHMFNATNKQLELTLIGHVTQKEIYYSLQKLLPSKPWIYPTISLYPVPHRQLLKAMKYADFGIVSHQILPSTENCFPTRIWEYMSLELPFFLQNHKPWVQYCDPWQCAIPINFTQDNWSTDPIIAQMKEQNFYRYGKPTGIYWEEDKFISAVEDIIDF